MESAATETHLRAAVVQAAPAMLEPIRGAQRVAAAVEGAAADGARLVVFPEALIPAYPRGLTFGSVVGDRSDAGRRAFARYWDAAVDVPGPITEEVGAAAARAQCWVTLGVVERSRASRHGGTLYCTLLYFAPDGQLAGKHRKLKPTAAERVVWGEGDGSTLTVIRTEFGGLGGLICWENRMPLARTAMYQKGVDVWVAPTADTRESWQPTVRHVALEGRCFVLSANQYVTRAMMPDDWETLPDGPDVISSGGSAIIDPLGNYLAGPAWNEEATLIADLDLASLTKARMDFDPVGHYARPDVFRLVVDETPRVLD